MPEIKNTFLAGKMNKSLDDRLLPEGEYRDALNIQVTKSEGADVGVIQNIKGNQKLSTSINLHASAKVLGSCFDEQNNIIYYFVHHGADRALAIKAQSTNTIVLENVNAVNPGDAIYYIDPTTGQEAPISGALDYLFVSTVNTQNNSITVVHDPAGAYGNLIPSVTIESGTVLLFSNGDKIRSKIYKYEKASNNVTELISNNILNFQENKYIQANVVENYLFFTDGYNEPRRIDTSASITPITPKRISVAKPAPQFAPTVEVLQTQQSDLENTGNYIEDKFVRFAYRYKFFDNTYSVYSPFSNIVFALNDNVLSESQIQDAYSKGELDFLTNKAKTISILPKSPLNGTGAWTSIYGVTHIDILMKASDSPAVMLLDSMKIDGVVQPFIYNSEKPKTVLPENQLTRVYDNVPRTAVTQEIVGNRVVYGNFTQGFDIDTTKNLPFTLITQEKNLNGTYLDYLGVKSNRTYEVGLVFSDDYGRTSPVMFGQKKSINIDRSVQDNYNKQIALSFNGDLQEIVDAGFTTYSVVVKQSEQEYYNIYTPGFGNIDGRSYFAVFGDNINKIPIDTSTYNSETNINTTKTKLYLNVENKSLSQNVTNNADGINIEAFEYTFDDPGVSQPFITNITNVLSLTNNADPVKINGVNITTSGTVALLDPQDPAVYELNGINHNIVQSSGSGFSLVNINLDLSYNTGVEVYVEGVKKDPVTDFSYDKSASPNPRITFKSGNIPGPNDQIAVFLKYNGLEVSPGGSSSLLSLSQVSGSIPVTKDTSIYNVFVAVDSFEEEFVVPETPFNAVNLTELKITGISTLTNFSAINETITTNSSDLTGLYKIDNNYLLAEVDGLYGVKFYNDTVAPVEIKYADLAVLETKGFESSIDIYYETATQGFVSNLSDGDVIRVNYFNCINLKTPARTGGTNVVWQESRIKGAFNEASMDYGVQAYFTDEDYGLIHRKSSLIYSGILNNNTKVNNTNQFPSGEDITRTLDPVYGSIQKLYADTDDLLIFQEEKVSQALIDKDIIYTAEGQGLTTSGQRVISQINAFATNYGIGKDPQSFTVYAGRKYFVDRPKGAVLRLSRDGITEISNYGMRSYFRDVLNNSTISLVSGSWDIYNKEYVLSIHSDSSLTLGFDESNNGWVSRYSYIAEDGGSLDGRFYTFKRGHLYEHNANSLHNVFYDQPVAPSTIELIFNESASVNKNFHNISYEGTNTWDITSINTDTLDQALPIKSNDEGYVDTDDTINLSIFKKYDEKYFANIINDSQSKPDEVVFGNSVSGVKGHFMKVVLSNDKESYQELFSISTNYNVNSY